MMIKNEAPATRRFFISGLLNRQSLGSGPAFKFQEFRTVKIILAQVELKTAPPQGFTFIVGTMSNIAIDDGR
jgi:hypothetical protein